MSSRNLWDQTNDLQVCGQTLRGHWTGLWPVTQQKGPCEPNLTCNRVEWINQPLCVPLRGNGKTFGERAKPQEEVARRCSPIRENARASARCQHQSTRQVLQVLRRVPNTPRESDSTRRQVMRAVCCAKKPAWVFWGYRSPVLHWVPPCGVYSSQTQSIIANTCLAEGGCMYSYMLKGCGMPNSTGTIFCFCLPSCKLFTLLEEPWRHLWIFEIH